MAELESTEQNTPISFKIVFQGIPEVCHAIFNKEDKDK